jgi:hypothetical protein
VPLLLRHRHSAPSALAWVEAALAMLTDAGFTGERRVVAQRTVVSYLLGALQNDHYSPLAGTGTAVMATQEQFPLLAETAATAREVSADEEFHRGLEIVLRGLGEP